MKISKIQALIWAAQTADALYTQAVKEAAEAEMRRQLTNDMSEKVLAYEALTNFFNKEVKTLRQKNSKRDAK